MGLPLALFPGIIPYYREEGSAKPSGPLRREVRGRDNDLVSESAVHPLCSSASGEACTNTVFGEGWGREKGALMFP
jgi:hypothetical protein